MLTIVHGSDLHFGKPHHPEAAEEFLESIDRLTPDLIVISGDLTQRAKVSEYRRAREYLDRLPDVPLVVTPGNHDVPLYRVFERIFTPFRNYRTYIREELNEVVRIPGLAVVSLNSAAPRTAIVNGRLRRSQLEFARRAFNGAPPEDLRAVVAHHHLAPAPDYEGDRPLPQGRQILDELEEMGVELVMGGHLHRAYIGNSLDVYPGEDREHGVVIVQSGTTTSRRGRARERAKNTFNVIRLGEDHLEVTHYMFFSDVGRFAPFSMHLFPRAPSQWFARDWSHSTLQTATGVSQALGPVAAPADGGEPDGETDPGGKRDGPRHERETDRDEDAGRRAEVGHGAETAHEGDS